MDQTIVHKNNCYAFSDGLLRNISYKFIVSGSLLDLEFDLTWGQNILVMSPGSSNSLYLSISHYILSF